MGMTRSISKSLACYIFPLIVISYTLKRSLGFITSNTILNYALYNTRFITKKEYQLALPTKAKVIFLQHPTDTIKNCSVLTA